MGPNRVFQEEMSTVRIFHVDFVAEVCPLWHDQRLGPGGPISWCQVADLPNPKRIPRRVPPKMEPTAISKRE